MLAADFERLAARTSLRAATLAMARRILVDGLSAAAAGREFGRPRDVASRAAGRIRAEALREQSCPECGRAFGSTSAPGQQLLTNGDVSENTTR